MNSQETMLPASGQLIAQRQLSGSVHSNMTRMAICLCIGLLGSGCGPRLETKADDVVKISNPMLDTNYSDDAEVPFVLEPKTSLAQGSRKVNFGSESASLRTRDMADWVIGSKDNLNAPFAIVDKRNAKVYVFSEDGKLYGAAPVLLGLGIGDDVAPGIANIRMGLIPPEQRTTPAGRFVARIDRNASGKEILWVDYENSISMHPVVTSNPVERRAERLATPTPLDNRISYGCINVPVDFFKDVVHSKFSGTAGIVYVMPETKPVRRS